MFLDNVTRKIQVVLTSAKTTLDMPILVDWVDLLANDTIIGLTPSNTNGVTLVDILSAPASGARRKVNGLTIYNRDTAVKTLQIIYNDNGTSYIIVDCALQVDDTLGYTDAGGWYTQDLNAARKTVPSLSDVQLATLIHAASSKATPVDADELPIADSASSFSLKKLTWANLKATLGSTFAALAGSASQNFAANALTTSGDIKLGVANAASQMLYTPYSGGALQLTTNSATTDRGWALGMVNGAGVWAGPKLSYTDATGIVSSSSSLAVTGSITSTVAAAGAFTTLSASANIAGDNAVSIQNLHASGYSSINIKNSAGTSKVGFGYGNASSANVGGYWWSPESLSIQVGTFGSAGTIATISSTGLAVTGTLSASVTASTSVITANTAYGVSSEQYSSFRFNNLSFAGGHSEIRNVVNGSSSTGSKLKLYTSQIGSGTLTERVVVDDTGLTTLNAGLAVTGTIKGSTTIGVGNATPATSGAGITFPVTQSASSDAKTLDDYEEGTWTPVYFGTTGTAGAYAATSVGYFTKIGRQVTVCGSITLTNKGSWTGDILFSTLPFVTASQDQIVGSCAADQVTFTGQLNLNCVGATTTFRIYNTLSGASNLLSTTAVANNSAFYFSLSYNV